MKYEKSLKKLNFAQKTKRFLCPLIRIFYLVLYFDNNLTKIDSSFSNFWGVYFLMLDE